ncbi:ABC transporter family substrate-binding protein [Microbacterium gorillae]|uniref:ABC transporter family substrate-binding protein n=1 Tax=Microbacterium gorillae TaxID=1231063 RepID=UPI00058C567F|nr:ABC transporter family substrate-binding protein [Microbacterium gorillae]
MSIATKKRLIAAAAAVAAGALLLSGCSTGGSGGGSTSGASGSADAAKDQADYNPQPRENLKEGGTFTTATTEISAQFNPFHADGTLYTSNVWRWYNPVIALFDADGTWHANEDYLSDVKKEDVDGKTVVTYTINPKAQYNDGTPIDWKSFENTWKSNDGENKDYAVSSTDGYVQIESVKAGKDDRQAVVTFKGEYAWVDGLFNFLLNPEVKDANMFNTAYVETPHAEWGAGPYTVDNYDKNNGTISFKRNDKWWGDKGLLDSRTFKTMESSASINAFKNGEIDATSASSQDRLAQVKDMKDINILRGGSTANYLLMLNSAAPSLDDLQVRTAIMKGIDRSVIAKIEFQGLDYTEKEPGSFNQFSYQPGYQDNYAKAGLGFDKDAAAKLLDEAGWKQAKDGDIREKDGKKLSIQFTTLGDDPTSAAEAKAINSMLAEIGVDAKIENRPSSEFSEVYTKREFGMFMMGFSSSDPFGFAYFCQIYCSDSTLNLSGTATPEMDKEIAEIAKIGNPDDQIKQGNELEAKLLKETAGIMPMYNGPTIVAVKKGLANYGAGLFFQGKPQDLGWEK